MRLLFVHDRLGAMGGAEVNAYVSARELRQRDHALGLIHGPPTGRSDSEWRNIFTECFSLQNGNVRTTVKHAVKRFEPDVIYVHKMADPEVLDALTKSERPVVRMVHDHDLYCLRSYKYFPLTRRICSRAAGWHCIFQCGAILARSHKKHFPFEWRSYFGKQRELVLNRRFQRMIVATEYMKQELLRNGFDFQRIEIHAPVPPSAGSPMPSRFSERNLIIYAGQIIRGKGVDVLLESLANVRLPFECLILGDGSHRPFCEQLSRSLGLADRVHFHGYVPPHELQTFYSDATVAVVSSVWPEPFGAVGLEAMRYAVPVVAFDAGGVREWLIDGQNGFLVPWMDRKGYAARIEQLLCDKTLARKLGQQGRQLVCEKWNFDRYISGLEAMFERVIHEGRTQPVPQI